MLIELGILMRESSGNLQIEYSRNMLPQSSEKNSNSGKVTP